MMKRILTYLLSLCVLLLGGSSFMAAQPVQEASSYAPLQEQLQAATHGQISQLEQTYISKSVPAGKQQKEGKVNLAQPEVEEVEVEFVKKFLESSPYFVALLCSLVLAYLFRAAIRIPKQHYTYKSVVNPLFILFCVYRI